MRRRFFLKGTAACLGGAVASTLGVDHRVADAQETAPTVVDVEFTVRDSSCGTGSQRANVQADAATNRVTVDGIIAARSACYTAELADATYDEDADALDLAVRTVEREDVDICAQCLTDVEYRAVVTFDGGLPTRAVVRHDDETVTETSLDSGPANWRQFAFDAANTAVDAGGRGPGSTPAIQWARNDVSTAPAVVTVGTAGSGSGDGASGNATAFVGAPGGGISALNVETGEERWTFDGVGPLAGTPAVVDGTVFAGGTDGQIAAVDATTGDPAWTRAVDGVVAAGPTATPDDEASGDGSSGRGTVYIATRGSDEGGRVHAIDPTDGALRWTSDAGGSVTAPPAVADERLSVARRDGTVLALSTADGQRQWELSVGDAAAHVSAPAVRGGTVYLAARTGEGDSLVGRVFAVDAASGESAWTADLGDSAVPRSLAVADGTVVAAAATYGDVAVIDERAGNVSANDADGEATATANGTGGTADATVTEGNGTAANATDTANGTVRDGVSAGAAGGSSAADGTASAAGRVYALDAGTGEKRWRRSVTAAVTAGPTVAGETAHVPLDGGVVALALGDGTERWVASFPARVTAPATPSASRLYVAVDDDRLVALAADGSGDGGDRSVTR
jgi:outer membrane protein assembly factor BamB